ncbi:hypothetical protein SDC9_199097 [bioreactor metagenome]|uniref:Uncharacterized protein n=1 Tax=bioreactor metagenome TaxID=1076179 RepID=A0A645IJI5_9ZZZZ
MRQDLVEMILGDDALRQIFQEQSGVQYSEWRTGIFGHSVQSQQQQIIDVAFVRIESVRVVRDRNRRQQFLSALLQFLDFRSIARFFRQIRRFNQFGLAIQNPVGIIADRYMTDVLAELASSKQ